MSPLFPLCPHFSIGYTFSMSELTVYLNGEMVPASEAKISVFDAGFLHGASTYTTMLAKNGVVFRFDRHLERLSQAVQKLGLNVAASTGELADAMQRVLEENSLSDARCRITLTPGGEGAAPATMVTATPLAPYPAEWYAKGIVVIVSSYKQWAGDPTCGVKTGCYLARVLSRQEAAEKGAADALWFTTDNYLAEACYSNVFLVLDGKICTPPINTPVLPGVVRETALELAESLGIPTDDATPLTVHEMLSADEIFLTSSTMGIRPVVAVEKHTVGEGEVGPITKQLMAAYAELLETECQVRDDKNEGS